MDTKRHQVCLAALLASLASLLPACGGDPDEGLAQSQIGQAGSASVRPPRWSGIQSCRGSINGKEVETSEEASIDAYTKTATRVQLKGIHVGPSDDFSCGALDFDAVVTMSTDLTMFENDMQQPCTSPAGRALVVDGFDGHGIDIPAQPGGPRLDPTLQFKINLRELPVDGGSEADTLIVCDFELTLK
jgi:hypothetical protein